MDMIQMHCLDELHIAPLTSHHKEAETPYLLNLTRIKMQWKNHVY